MMTKECSRRRAVVNYIFSTLAFVLVAATLTFSQVKDFEYKLYVDGVTGDYAANGLKHSDFGALTIKTNRRKIKVEEFDMVLARGPRPVFWDKQIKGDQFDLKQYAEAAREGDRIVIEIKSLSDKKIELSQFNSIVTLPLVFD